MKYIIIAGTSKGGSTSLFDYLSNHPEIEGSSIKQTRFFLNKKWFTIGSKPAYHYTTHPDSFDKYYGNKGEDIIYRLESTPDYLYDDEAPELIHKYFGENARIIFILRDPVDRVKSWYKFGKQRGSVPPEETLNSFFEKNLQPQSIGSDELAYSSVETGLYSNYLPIWYKYFPNNVYVSFLEDLKSNPDKFMASLCDWLKLSGKPYQDFEFKVKNKSVSVKNRFLWSFFRSIRRKLIPIYTTYPKVKTMLIPLKKVYSSTIGEMMVEKTKEELPNENSLRLLQKLYKDEAAAFEKITGIEYPYKNLSSSSPKVK